MNKNLLNHKPFHNLFIFLVASLLLLPLTALASTTTLIDEVEIIRKNQQLFLYLHSNATVVHQSLETNEKHLTIELEQISLSPTVRTNYLNAPNVNSIVVKQLPNHKVRLEIEGTDLNEPIVGFRELGGKMIPTIERVGNVSIQKTPAKVTMATTQPAIVPPKAVTPKVTKAIVTPSPTVEAFIPTKPVIITTPPIAVNKTPLIASITTSTTPTVPTSSTVSTQTEENGIEAEEPTTRVAALSWEAVLLKLIIGASHHLDWCVYGLLGTVLLSLLASWGLKRKQHKNHNIPPSFINQDTPINVSSTTTLPQIPQSQANNINQRRAALKEALPPKHQRILDRVQRQMEGTAPSIPAHNPALQAEYKSTPKMPVAQASKQYQQQQNFGTPTTMPKKPSKVAENTSNVSFNQQGERVNQKVVRPWQPERLGNGLVENIPTANGNSQQPSTGEAFLESINAYLDPASQKNIQQGIRNNKQGL